MITFRSDVLLSCDYPGCTFTEEASALFEVDSSSVIHFQKFVDVKGWKVVPALPMCGDHLPALCPVCSPSTADTP